ncbi:AraC family transcriptional regulator [Kibdelosporangium phytohabitans]|uniref:AraC family transcriptional regulator n=2 Tax=Kibdelosporangium phytohabitans TaxID=860235 RepID=A0A0N9IF01_9PSEU|nr:GyrI-like domain-containing protein [Kibdelosporangium phytohabitans]ALG15097.1 AraC family transcriptional regulator [Kibdelosporangium phytohabitans]
MSSAVLVRPEDVSVKPEIIQRPEQPYAAVRGTVTMQTFSEIADRLPELIGSLLARGVHLAGAPFFRYTLIDMQAHLEVEAGIPTLGVIEGEGDVFGAVLPAGRYVSLTHVGHPDELVDVTGRLLTWADGEGLSWDKTDTDQGEQWGCRLEVLKTDPRVEPDMTQWETDLVFRLAEQPAGRSTSPTT